MLRLLELKYTWNADTAEKTLTTINDSELLPDSIKELLKNEISEIIKDKQSLKEYKYITKISSPLLPKNLEFTCFRLLSDPRSISFYIRAVIEKNIASENNNDVIWVDNFTLSLSTELKDINKSDDSYQSNSFYFIFKKFRDDLKKNRHSAELLLLANYLKAQYDYINNNPSDRNPLAYYDMSVELLLKNHVNKNSLESNNIENVKQVDSSKYNKLIDFLSKKLIS